MGKARQRDDRRDTIYRVGNSLVGVEGKLRLNVRQMKKLDLFIRQLDRLYCVDVISYLVTSTGYELLCAAPAELPTHEDLEAHFIARYGRRRQMPDFEDYDTYFHWAERLRNFSCLLKDLEQRFTQWYNRREMSGRRKGTLWRGRFWSQILRKASQFARVLNDNRGAGESRSRHRRGEGRWTYGWQKLVRRFPFLESVPGMVSEAAEGAFYGFLRSCPYRGSGFRPGPYP